MLGEGVAVEGDILLVGDVAMRLHGTKVPTLSALRPDAEPGTSTNLSGNLLEVPPSTLLRYLAVIKKTGVLQLTSPPLQSGSRSPAVTSARSSSIPARRENPIPALTAILRWKGTFDVGPPSSAASSLLLGLDAVLPAVGSASRPSMLPKPPRP